MCAKENTYWRSFYDKDYISNNSDDDLTYFSRCYSKISRTTSFFGEIFFKTDSKVYKFSAFGLLWESI